MTTPRWVLVFLIAVLLGVAFPFDHVNRLPSPFIVGAFAAICARGLVDLMQKGRAR